MHNKDHSSQPSLVMPELMGNVQQAVLQNLGFIISEFSGQFPQMAVTSWPLTLLVGSYDTGIQTLVHRYDKCSNNGGDYVEK